MVSPYLYVRRRSFLLLLGGSFFTGLMVCDWSQEKLAKQQIQNAEVLRLLASGVNGPVAFFVRDGDAVLQHPNWHDLQKVCLDLEEPLITNGTLMPALRYLEIHTDLVRERNLLSQPEFYKSFDALLEEEGAIDLPRLIQAFDMTVLLQTDPQTNVFSARDTVRDWGMDRSAILRPLRTFVTRKGTSSSVDLIRGFANKYWRGWAVRELVDELCRTTQRLLGTSKTGKNEGGANINSLRMPGDGCFQSNVAIWTAVVLARTDCLLESAREEEDVRRHADLFLVVIDQLARDFLDRCDQDASADPLVGLWPELRSAVESVVIGVHEIKFAPGKLVREFSCYLGSSETHHDDPRWLVRLRALLSEATRADEGAAAGVDTKGAVP